MKTTEEIDDILRGNAFFSGLKTRAREALSEICLFKELKKNEVLFYEGQKGYAFFLLVSGAIRVSRTTEAGREIAIKVLKPGEVFGEVVLFELPEYPASARALLKSAVLVIPKNHIHCLMEEPAFRRSFLGLLMNKLRYLTERIVYLTMHDVEERFFLFLKEHYGEKDEFHIDFSKKDFASAIGTNPETFSRLVAKLTADKRIRWTGKKLSIGTFPPFPVRSPRRPQIN